MQNAKGKIHRASIAEFFRARIQDAKNDTGVDTSEMAEFYLVNLLDEYHESSKLFHVEGEGPVMKPLALLLKRAFEAEPLEQRKYLKRLGDTALYVAGFFTDYIHKSMVNLDYYIGMGGGAYGSLSNLVKQKHFQELYYELAIKFAALVNVLSEVAPWSQHIDNRQLVQIYARWLETGDEKLKEVLEREGIDTSDEQHSINP